MIDEEGDLGNTDEAARTKAVENHYKWVEAAQFLGCTDIRVNARGEGTPEKVAAAAADGLTRLTTFAKDYNIAILVENHGVYSSNGQWPAGVLHAVGDDPCGTLPDLGNSCTTRTEPPFADEYNMYTRVTEKMPLAKSATY